MRALQLAFAEGLSSLIGRVTFNGVAPRNSEKNQG
jgi:hypothetical protein